MNSQWGGPRPLADFPPVLEPFFAVFALSNVDFRIQHEQVGGVLPTANSRSRLPERPSRFRFQVNHLHLTGSDVRTAGGIEKIAPRAGSVKSHWGKPRPPADFPTVLEPFFAVFALYNVHFRIPHSE